ncbi:integrin beta-like protein C [Antedon mediterranea]|uniref:integrin beta-like protein C n=1 Tax=Antedon mediterranea TaxID=105859 RepID=UPI003AF78156
MMSQFASYGLLVFIGVFHFGYSSHFRGAIFTWKPTSLPNQIEISWRISWRRSSQYCNETTIANQQLLGGGSLSCTNGCSGSVSLSFYCTDFSTTEDWTTGVRSVLFSSSGNKTFVMSFTGGNWIGGLHIGSNGNWALPMSVDLTVRQDTGRPNSSPVSSVTPIVRLQHGCSHTFTIPVNDPDGDMVRCRWAAGSSECDSVCNGFPNAALNEETCTLSYNAVYTTGWYAVALMIEDFGNQSSTTPLSKIPLQFLVNVFVNQGQCDAAPEFVYPTPTDGSCVGVSENETYIQSIVARSANGISDIMTVSPLGFHKSKLVQIDGDLFSVNLTWTPSANQIGENIICYTAESTTGQTSPQTCITLAVGAYAPKITSLEPQPGAEVFVDHSVYRMAFDNDILRPTRPTFIRFYDVSNGNIVYTFDVSSSPDVSYLTVSRSVEFTTRNISLHENHAYYILTDAGVARGMGSCEPQSQAIQDPSFWTFTINENDGCGSGCLNGGTCATTAGDSSFCECPHGFMGQTCKTVVGYCACALP